jgi:hypothetical protein
VARDRNGNVIDLWGKKAPSDRTIAKMAREQEAETHQLDIEFAARGLANAARELLADPFDDFCRAGVRDRLSTLEGLLLSEGDYWEGAVTGIHPQYR